MATELTQEVANRVSRAIVNAGLTKLDVAEATGIPYSTLNRKLKGRGDFSFEELFQIATVTGTHPSSFVPLSFASERLAS